MATEIVSCGLPGAEKLPDAIDTLLRVLEEYQLDTRWALFHRPLIKTWENGQVAFRGNFLALSHVFDVRTDDPDVVYALTCAINANLDRDWPAVDISRGTGLPRWAP